MYHYDIFGHLISETDELGALNKDYIWLENLIPVAQIDNAGTESISYLHTDHLLTARIATDDSQAVIWRWEGEAFGGTEATELSTVAVNLRFPGQYFDDETNLHYNHFRYYDPTIGRYVTSDPIGLLGGYNSYIYPPPRSFSDWFGLRRDKFGVGGSLPFVGGFDVGILLTDGSGDQRPGLDIGLFFEVSKPISNAALESGVGKLKLGLTLERGDGGRGDAVQVGSEIFAGFGAGIAIGLEPQGDGPSKVNSIKLEGGVIGFGANQTVEFTLTARDLGRLAAAMVSGDFSQKIIGASACR